MRIAQQLLFARSGKNFDVAIRVSKPEYLKKIDRQCGRRMTFRGVIFTCTSKICHISISGLFDLITLNVGHMLCSALG